MRRIGKFLALAAIFAVAGYGIAHATVTGNNVITAQTPNRIVYQFGPSAACVSTASPFPCCSGAATGCGINTAYTIYSAGANGSICKGIYMNSSDTVTHAITFEILGGNVVKNGPGTNITTSAAAATGSFTLPITVTGPANWPGLATDSDGNPYISLNSGYTLTAQTATLVSSANATTVVNFAGACADF
jgi:hypothetical protein